jgi:hypothetical protein
VRRVVHALPVLVLLVALPLAWAAARDDDAPVKASGAQVGVTDDDGGQPMFELAALSPGRSITRCIRVRFGGGDAGAVRLAGRVDGASLAGRIFLVVERGTGGGFDGCRGFRGQRVFEGTLAEFDLGADDRAWRAEEGDAATYRFTATAAADLPERADRAAATFTWTATALPGSGGDDGGDKPGGGDGPGGDTPPVHAGTPGGAPGAVPGVAGAGPGSGPDGAAGPGDRDRGRGGRAGRDGTSAGAGRGGADGRGGAGRAELPGGGGTPDRDRRSIIDKVVDAVRDVAVDVGQRAAFPMVLLLLIGLFLAAQHRIDQRDPKLALAPVHRETDLPFTPLRLGGGGE